MKVFNKWLTLIFVLAKCIIVSYKMKIRYREYLLQFECDFIAKRRT